LKRFVEDRPILARRASRRERLWRWCRRNPTLATLTACVAVLLVAVSVVSSVSALWLGKELRRAEKAEQAEKDARRDARDKLCRSYRAEANARRLSGRPGQRFESLEAMRKAVALARDLELPAERFAEFRDCAIACLALPDVEVVKEWNGYPGGSDWVDFDPALAHYARSDLRGNVSIRRVADDAEIASLPGSGNRVGLRFDPTGQYLAVFVDFVPANRPNPLKVWKLTGPRPVVVLEEPANQHHAFAFHPHRAEIAFGLADGTLRVCDLSTGQRLREWRTQPVSGLLFDPAGNRLALSPRPVPAGTVPD